MPKKLPRRVEIKILSRIEYADGRGGSLGESTYFESSEPLAKEDLAVFCAGAEVVVLGEIKYRKTGDVAYRLKNDLGSGQTMERKLTYKAER